MRRARLLVLSLLLATALSVGVLVAPAVAGESTATGEPTVRLAVSSPRVSAVAGMPHATTLRVRSTDGRVAGTVTVRRVQGPVVRSWSVGPGKRFSVRWDATNRKGRDVRPGRYRVTALVHPVDAPDQVRRSTRTVRVLSRGQGWSTRYGFVKAVPVIHRTNRFHIEVHERANQVLVVDAANHVVRRIPVGGNPAISKPRLSYVADRTPMSYDYAWTKRLPWFVRLVGGRGIGSHTIPRYISTGEPTIPVSALGRKPGGPAPPSAGCLRMHDVNARWFYDNVPAGTPVHWM